jgi:hypothetical protein
MSTENIKKSKNYGGVKLNLSVAYQQQQVDGMTEKKDKSMMMNQ